MKFHSCTIIFYTIVIELEINFLEGTQSKASERADFLTMVTMSAILFSMNMHETEYYGCN